jgi:hypothetical protein
VLRRESHQGCSCSFFTRSPLAAGAGAGALTEAEDNDGRTAQSALHWCSAVPLYAACPGKPGTTGTTGDGHGQGWCDMGEGRHGRARRGKGREGAKNDASASLSAKAAAWFLTRMAESHPPLLCSVALLHSTPLHSTFSLPASAARPWTIEMRYEISAPRRVPPRSHDSTTAVPRLHTQPASHRCTVALLATGTATEPHPEPEPRNGPTTVQNGMLVGGVRAEAIL